MSACVGVKRGSLKEVDIVVLVVVVVVVVAVVSAVVVIRFIRRWKERSGVTKCGVQVAQPNIGGYRKANSN